MPDERLPSIVREKAVIYGSLASNGGAIVLLVTALNVLGQHGEEFNALRHDIADLRKEGRERQTKLALTVAQIDTKVLILERRTSELERLLKDPYARPDAFTRSDYQRETNELVEGLKNWTLEALRNGSQK